MSSLEAANLFNVKDLVAVITGGGSGIGLMMTKTLALNGAHKVYIIGRRQEVLDAAAKESPHGNIIPLVGDVTSKDALQSIVSHIEKDVGYINVLIANSGIGGPQSSSITRETSLEDYQSALWSQSFDEYTKTFAVNTSAVFFCTVAFLKLLDAGNGKGNVGQTSQVIATGSIAGFNRRVPGGYAYGQSKAATTLLMKAMATNLVPYKIRANVVAPGLFPSDLAAGIIGDGVFPKETIPAERVGTPEDMGGAILYLTSRAGAYCNGNVVLLDGGRLSLMPGTY
ncbi:hypothetical protein HO173_003658 [Letharia columbiana]|uniref:Uncharacterized protein n=1 Tax=Letharia columbiana TaxID=112416 RepID=A0A8H6G0S2_9LECA|nr:uncharacterized protein HO173_013260 [Letharia columbiana]XP_037167685.1 uncharacterized protein HO173_003658 [Letharia columbiana]KAF6223160.1 hypothetical protein HO173_013260 [Letharia columbiana]KAF6238378.1 hypothetical protein HO173_003658 [Letharia columbiana]